MTALTLAALASVVHADAKSEAIALHDKGIDDMRAGNIDAACRELAASVERYPDSGTKGALAECLTMQHRVASAWRLWRDLADTAPDDDLKADAKLHADELEPKLPRYVVKVAGTPPAGMTVAVGDTPIDPTLSVPLPIDPPQITITVKAPGRVTWTQTVPVTEGTTITIEIPQLPEAPRAPEPAPPQPVSPTPPRGGQLDVIVEPPDPGHSRRVAGLSVAIAGLASVGIGVTYGMFASSDWDSARSMCGGQLSACPGPAYGGARAAADDAHSEATISTVAFSVGTVAVLAGTVLWLTAPARPAGVRPTVAPAVSRTSAGLTWSMRF